MNTYDGLIKADEAVSMFCRLNINIKKNIPIRSSEMGLLILIVKNEDKVTPIMAADFFKVSRSMITAMVTSLLSLNYIIKIPSKEDKRSFTLSPTENGKNLVARAYEEYLKVLEILKSAMGNDDFKMLIALIEKANSILLEEKWRG